ncbi:MAG: prephenate dehydrogenase/arogenate dehydrogenase family protein [Nevskiaceae bacterium]|jgi:chorismate mutase/prephenate dehydrogenase|nr:prephenate dehydrogenase/arogenate dehydrogenase family protein [Nevskiaceae bacterium]
MTLDELRRELDQLDGELLGLIAKRQSISRQVAEAKRATGYPTRDYEREREVILGVRKRGEQLGVPGDLAEKVMRLLIRSSLTTQEQASVVSQGAGGGRRALVIGGNGKMGGWFARFLLSQGFDVLVADPNGAADGIPEVPDWRTLPDLDAFAFIVVATPLGISRAILSELALRKPAGVVFDLGSLKSPLRGGLNALKAAGVKVTSLHPMFGPNTELLSGRHVIFIDMGNAEALAAARGLFAPTMAEQAVMSLEEHDRLIAYVLGLSHALNIAFFTALAESGEAAPRLAQLSSTTFDSQLDVASAVAEESPELYYEIQALNDYGAESLQALSSAVQRLQTAVLTRDFDTFRLLMQQGLDYLQGRREVTARRA